MTGLYSADTDDLDAFVGRSGRDVDALGVTADELDVGRGGLALLPLPVFVQSPTLDRYRSLVAFMGENGRFVADVSDALRRFGAHTSAGVYRADASLVDQALATRAVERLDALEQTLIDRGARPEVAAAVTAEVAAALKADPTLSFDAATRAGFAAHQGISLDEAARAERAFRLSPPEVAAVLDAHFDVIAARHGEGDQITIEDLQDAVTDGTLDPEARDVAYRLAADSVLFADFDVAMQTDLSDEPLGNGFAWDTADGIIGRDDVAAFPAKDHQARILRAWHPLVETAAQGYDLDAVDSHASADDVTAFIEDEDIPVYVRLAVFDVYAEASRPDRDRAGGPRTGVGLRRADLWCGDPARRRPRARRGPDHTGRPSSHRRWRWSRFRRCRGRGRCRLRPPAGGIRRVRVVQGERGEDRPRRCAQHRAHRSADPDRDGDRPSRPGRSVARRGQGLCGLLRCHRHPTPRGDRPGSSPPLPRRFRSVEDVRHRRTCVAGPGQRARCHRASTSISRASVAGPTATNSSSSSPTAAGTRTTTASGAGPTPAQPSTIPAADRYTGPLVRTHETASPRGFGNAADFEAFGHDLYSGLEVAGYDDVTAIFQGSAVTGESFRTGAAFDSGRESDFDIALASPGLLDRASSLGIGLRSRGTRTGPLTASQLQRLGLGDLAADLGVTAGRPVRFMIFESAAGAMARGPSIEVPR